MTTENETQVVVITENEPQVVVTTENYPQVVMTTENDPPQVVAGCRRLSRFFTPVTLSRIELGLSPS